jgi:hypothetical protein
MTVFITSLERLREELIARGYDVLEANTSRNDRALSAT